MSDQTPTVVCSAPDVWVWVVRVPKPSLPEVSWRAVRYAAVLAFSVGFNLGFLLP